MLKKKYLVLVMSCLIILCLLLTACGTGGNDAKVAKEGGIGGDDAAKPKEIVVATKLITNILDAAQANATITSTLCQHIFDGIVEFDENLNVIPGVAKSWERIDELTWEFTIGEGFKFHNGDDLEIADVIYSIERLRDIPKAVSTVEHIESIVPVDGNKIRVKTTKPVHSLLRDFAGNVLVLNKSHVKEVGQEAHAKAPIGTGPYKLAEFIPGQKVVMERWEESPFEKPDIEKITYKAIEEDSSRYIALETGEADVVPQVHYTDLERAKGNDKINIFERNTLRVGFISMNTTKPPFDNKLVRRAIAHAVNKEAFALVEGNGMPIDSMISMNSDGYYSSDKIPEYDLEKAKELLKKAGYENGLEFTMWIYAPDPKVELLQADLKTIGVDMKIENLEFGVFLERVLNAEYQILLGSWASSTGDSLNMLNCYTTDSFAEDNISFYSNPKIDELYKKAEQSLDEAEVVKILKEIQEIGAEDMPMIPTTSIKEISCFRKDIEGIQFYPTGIVKYDKAVIK